MTELDLNDPALDPPGRPDFRRVGKGTPMVKDAYSDKWVRYRRSSSAGKVLDDESNLNDWTKRTILVGAAQLPEVLAMVSVLNPETDKKKIRDYVEECIQAGKGNARKVQGQAVHIMFDRIDFETDWVPAPQFKKLVDEYVRTLELWGLVPIEGEVQCVNDKYHLAGTLDRRYRTLRQLVAPDGSIIPIGSVIVGDTKTGQKLEYAAGTYVTQLAAYVDSDRYDVLTDERTAFDPPNHPDWALVVHALPETQTVELHWADLEQGRQGLALAGQVWEWRRRAGLLTPATPALRMAPEPSQVPQELAESLEAPEIAEPAPEPLTAEELATVKEWLRGRVQAIIKHSDVAARHLQRRWPDGMPGLKAEGQTQEQLAQLEQVLDRVEADYSVPWGETDPRSKAARDGHPSTWVERWSQPVAEPVPDAEMEALRDALMEHPRKALLTSWFAMGDISYPIAHALYEFAMLPVAEWSDEDVSTMLAGTINALGYTELGALKDEDAPKVMSAVFAIASGNAMLMYDSDDKPVVRFNVVEAKG